MGYLLETKQSTKDFRARANKAYLWRANLPETLWKTIFELLTPENANKLRQELNSMAIKEGFDDIANLQNDKQWEQKTNNGNKPYLLIGNGNFRIYGSENDKPNQLFISTGNLPNDNEIYEDEFHYSSIMVTFPSSNVKRYTINENY